jgi:heme exporter protein D
MYWHTFSDFLAMGTHGVYVWGSVGVFALLLALEPLLVRRGHTSLIARLRRELNADTASRKRPTREP